jgi:hypothetical protein
MFTLQNSSSYTEKRKYPRIETSNDIFFILLDNNGEEIEKGQGRTRDLSQSGVLLETQKPLKGSFIILMTLDLEGNEVQVKGIVAHTRESERPGYYLTGIRFEGSRKDHINAIVAFVKNYYRKKHKEQNQKNL